MNPQEPFVDIAAIEDNIDDQNLCDQRIEERAREQHTCADQLDASCPACPPPAPSSCSAPTPEVRNRDSEPWCRSAETVALATVRAKSSVVSVGGRAGWTILAICPTRSTRGMTLVCCRWATCLLTVGKGGAGRDKCGRLVPLWLNSRGRCRVSRGRHTSRRCRSWIAHAAGRNRHTQASPRYAYGWCTQKLVVDDHAACSVTCGVLRFHQLTGVRRPDLRGMRRRARG